jgi:hypothetical protein
MLVRAISIAKAPVLIRLINNKVRFNLMISYVWAIYLEIMSPSLKRFGLLF